MYSTLTIIIIIIIMIIIIILLLLLLYYFNNIGLQVSPTYQSQCFLFSLINRYVPFNMNLMDLLFFFFFVILYNVETWPMWKIYSVPWDSTLNKFYCIWPLRKTYPI
jgi:hypothetical protein